MTALMNRHPEKILFFAAISLMLIGIVVIYSASGPYCQFLNPPKPTWHYLARQASWAVVALIAMFFMYRLNYHVIVKFSPIFLICSLLGLAAVLILSQGEIKRWIYIAGFTFQPSEFFKIAYVAFMAKMAAKNASEEFSYKKYATIMISMVLGSAFIIKEPDLGTTALVVCVAIALLFLAGFPKKVILIASLSFAFVASVLVFGLKYEIDRIDQYAVTLTDPFNPKASYQTRQALVSLGSGGILGKGLGNGGQKHLFLPARHTDFILAAAAEEGGFLIVTGILALFCLLGWSGYRIAKSAMDIEGQFFAWGIMLFLILQATVNIGVAMGVFPITGMTLPFLSYGGSSLLVCSVGVGMIASVARQSKSPQHYFLRFKR
jgi:cell division protein FtsW